MSWFKNISISKKLLISFAVLAALTAVVGFFGQKYISEMNERSAYMYENSVASLKVFCEIRADFEEIGGMMKTVALDPNLETKKSALQRIREIVAVREKNIEKYGTLISNDEGMRLFNEVKNISENLSGQVSLFIQSAEARNYKICAKIFTEQINPLRQKLRKAIIDNYDFNVRYAELMYQNNEETYSNATMWMITISMFAVISALILGVFIARIINRPINLVKERVAQLQGLCITNLGNGLQAMSKGDLTAKVEKATQPLNMNQKDEVGILANIVDQMILKSQAGIDAYELVRDRIEQLVHETDALTKAGKEGKLDTRGEAAKFEGVYKGLIKGINETLDAVILPVKEGSDVLEKISKGDLTVNVIGDYSGDHQIIKKSINTLIGKIKQLIHETDTLSKAGKEGKLDTRGDVSKFEGAYKELIQGVNDILDAVVLPVKEGSDVLEMMAKGDLTIRVNGDYRGDHQLIKKSINGLADSFYRALTDVTTAVQATASASSQISSSSEEMAAGAQEQSRQTSDIVSAIEQMTGTILKTTKDSGMAAEKARQAGEIAEEGGRIVEETIIGMNRIAEVVKRSALTVKELGKSSDQIGEIVQVINDIADQTNLLALNAAIEAARAGEQGRGFAVVADEVRKLAERTAKATKEIAGMIKQIQNDTGDAVESMEVGALEVEKGKELSEQAGKSLNAIISGARDTVEMISLVAAASEEQSAASEQISKNIEVISTITNQSATGIQQVARAAEDLNRQTESLKELVSQFSLDETDKKVSIRSESYIRSNGKFVAA
ncbi:MAG: methyl-accepting chemotaxis protein [Ignavibacteriales bacterium]|nr:methyl-accepting chemotaxis protein [Ignavibacteriales bacterium]